MQESMMVAYFFVLRVEINAMKFWWTKNSSEEFLFNKRNYKSMLLAIAISNALVIFGGVLHTYWWYDDVLLIIYLVKGKDLIL